jgi:Domain of unknown function (DUF4258)
MVVKKDEVIQKAIGALENGNLRFSKHALIRMKERKIVISDIKETIYNAQRESIKDQLTDDGSDWKYALRGKNEAGDKEIRLVLLFDGQNVLVVTAIDLNREKING